MSLVHHTVITHPPACFKTDLNGNRTLLACTLMNTSNISLSLVPAPVPTAIHPVGTDAHRYSLHPSHVLQFESQEVKKPKEPLDLEHQIKEKMEDQAWLKLEADLSRIKPLITRKGWAPRKEKSEICELMYNYKDVATQTQFANFLGKSQSTLSDWLSDWLRDQKK